MLKLLKIAWPSLLKPPVYQIHDHIFVHAATFINQLRTLHSREFIHR